MVVIVGVVKVEEMVLMAVHSRMACNHRDSDETLECDIDPDP